MAKDWHQKVLKNVHIFNHFDFIGKGEAFHGLLYKENCLNAWVSYLAHHTVSLHIRITYSIQVEVEGP